MLLCTLICAGAPLYISQCIGEAACDADVAAALCTVAGRPQMFRPYFVIGC